MHTSTTLRSETRTISIASPPEVVLDLVGDARRLPSWAPNFARSVRPDGAHWIVEDGAREARISVRIDRAHGTVDLLSAENPRRGAFARVLPNGGGSEFLFTLFFAPGTEEAAVTRQMEVVEEELESVRALCERP
jgi:uncharacterized protein YndB with AHSA1/START domain